MEKEIKDIGTYRFDLKKVWCVIPVYNNAGSILDVVSRCLRQIENVLVVDDGSTDIDLGESLAKMPVSIVRHPENRGKGAAIMSALKFVSDRDADYMITIDADGQHYPEDLPLIFRILEANAFSLVIGCRDFSGENVPLSSRIGCKISNFWIRLETGIDPVDSQSGFRAYPVKVMSKLDLKSRRYNFETESLVKCVWEGAELHKVQVRTWYPKPSDRVSHFRPWIDSLLVSCTHCRLLFRLILSKIIPSLRQ